MKALTLWQPWASLIGLGVKSIETRSWSTRYRGPLAIHAAARPVTAQETFTNEVGVDYFPNHYSLRIAAGDYEEMPLGAVVATCRLVDVVPIIEFSWGERGRFIAPSTNARGELAGGHLSLVDPAAPTADLSGQIPYGDFSPGRFAWLLADVEPCEPIPAKGHQGLWPWLPGEEEK